MNQRNQRGDGRKPIGRWSATRLPALLGVAALVSMMAATGAGADDADSRVGAAGINTTLPDTDSAVTVAGTGNFAGMSFTVNQTRELVNQAISVSWKGGVPTDSVTNMANDYVQIMQCWGDPVTADDGSQGPAPENCEFGGQSQKSWQGNVPGVRVASNYRHYQDRDSDGEPQVDVPFAAVDGTTVPKMFDESFNPEQGGAWWLNPYFSFYSTNEIPYAPTFADGTGNQLFTADTGLEAPGLGCGQAVQAQPAGAAKVPQCWLVIVPRSNFTRERGAEPPDDLAVGVQGAPFQPRVWAHRTAIPLSFKPLATSCQLGADERRIVGSELLAPAMSNWTPALCDSAATSPFNYSSLSDTQARAQLTGAAAGGAAMSVVTRPIDPAAIPDGNAVTYAPMALTGLVIGFNIERVLNANLDADGQIPAAEQALAAQRVNTINLTPRLVAKLLTESYQASFLGVPTDTSYDWARNNPTTLIADPEFVKYNAEFEMLSAAAAPAMAGLVVELNSSDAAYQLWHWILSDPEAAGWLAGTPDGDGMKVNPWYSTNPTVHPAGQGLPLPIDNFPKNDPFSIKIDQYPSSFPALGMLDLMPYQNSMKSAALAARTTDLGDRTSYDPSIGGITYMANGPQYQGSRFTMSVTDAASAARYGLQTAALRNAAGKFVAPTTETLLAGEKAMTPSAVPGVLLANPASTSPAAYPLTSLVYAATIAPALDAGARADFASLIRFAAGSGQRPGVSFGDLPPGYAPLPTDLGEQALAASAVIAAGGAPPQTSPAPTPGPTSTSTSTSSSSPSSPSATSATSSRSTSVRPPPARQDSGPAPDPTTSDAASTEAVETTAAQSAEISVTDATISTESNGTPQLASARTPRDTTTPPVLPIAFGAGLVAAVLAPFVNRRRSRQPTNSKNDPKS